MKPNYLESVKSRLMSKVSKTDSCWNWTGCIHYRNGYGKTSFKGRSIYTHQVSFLVYKGEIPEGLEVCHSCDNRVCLNPSHLWLGTQLDNMNDMRVKGRAASGDNSGARKHPEKIPRGESHGSSKLTEIQVCEIREKFSEGRTTQRELSRQYGVHFSAISAIILRKKWAHID